MGCSKGYYLLDAQTGCQACPVGSYTELDNATSCTACPPGWSTPSTASQDVSQCQGWNQAFGYGVVVVMVLAVGLLREFRSE